LEGTLVVRGDVDPHGTGLGTREANAGAVVDYTSQAGASRRKYRGAMYVASGCFAVSVLAKILKKSELKHIYLALNLNRHAMLTVENGCRQHDCNERHFLFLLAAMSRAT